MAFGLGKFRQFVNKLRGISRRGAGARGVGGGADTDRRYNEFARRTSSRSFVATLVGAAVKTSSREFAIDVRNKAKAGIIFQRPEWPPLSESTIKRVGAMGPLHILVDTRKMLDTIKVRPTVIDGDRGFEVSSAASYDIIHERGNDRVPKRAFMAPALAEANIARRRAARTEGDVSSVAEQVSRSPGRGITDRLKRGFRKVFKGLFG